MKKLITVILILALLIPAAAFADRDPIIGYWYLYMDLKLYPEMKSAYKGNYDDLISMYKFEESGVINALENDTFNGQGTPVFAGNGKWSKTSTGYEYSLVGIGQGTLTIEGDDMWLSIQNGTMYMKLRRIVPFNPYGDYRY